MERFVLSLGVYVFRILYWLTVLAIVIGGMGSKAENESWWPTIFISAFLLGMAHVFLLKPSRFLAKARDGGDSVETDSYKARTPYSSISTTPRGARFEVSLELDEPRYERPHRQGGKPARWYQPGESVNVQGYQITSGMIYVGESLPAAGGYGSRYLGRKDNDPSSLAALALLPKELMGQTPRASEIKAKLEQVCISGPAIISTKRIYEIMGAQIPAAFGRKDAEGLGLLVEGMGFGLAPDVRFHNAKPTILGIARSQYAVMNDWLGRTQGDMKLTEFSTFYRNQLNDLERYMPK
ncbi:MAG: hypothetical protein DI628_00155 [Blastochloris viridis]|uniref:Uncharacterized protein n=1 Tax=Blastochloris viridis TaxID=1079 RepID=A0A6N4RCN5_BLAVI|nr:MAG: hypothetical protein DI628_00155 [Blastochloris viridis]